MTAVSEVHRAIDFLSAGSHGQQAQLSVDDIEVVYDDAILAVSGISLEVAPRGVIALLGANGAGKSTTLKAISGLLQADRARITRGSIRFRGQSTADVAANRLVRNGIVHVLEGRHVFSHLTVEENLHSGAYVRRISSKELQAGLERVYEWFPRLRQKRKVKAGYTSGGEQQMLAIGRALMTAPKLVLLDEPSMGLAPLIVQEIFEIVDHLNRSEGVSFLIAEQNIPVALQHAHYGYVLESGRLALHGSAHELRNNSALQEAYLGKKQ
ncbi:ABC transporter ATP-binding protein [Hyphomicrobium sulfonivorans]|uniref:ABC transporter ATP-binding protein n=1 Tax=Hyphomicrobium sulfonivorans TaxID=121290 RepID=UPI00156EA137|nr:ABC transporter ATP-binding protein [Hyphomicrobium sulfonivorans]MBI1649921.1 ABC transporter ATP-binding protein [Hyphomicrobium sulfonivorans]NSL72839.1 ABC transporter ATP-binding protein [Hyphomicrobium sulfonivorans]